MKTASFVVHSVSGEGGQAKEIMVATCAEGQRVEVVHHLLTPTGTALSEFP
jgi:hypothetical protein